MRLTVPAGFEAGWLAVDDATRVGLLPALVPCETCGGRIWRLHTVCCGFDDGYTFRSTWQEVEDIRASYVKTLYGHHDRTAIIDHCPDCHHGYPPVELWSECPNNLREHDDQPCRCGECVDGLVRVGVARVSQIVRPHVQFDAGTGRSELWVRSSPGGWLDTPITVHGDPRPGGWAVELTDIERNKENQ